MKKLKELSKLLQSEDIESKSAFNALVLCLNAMGYSRVDLRSKTAIDAVTKKEISLEKVFFNGVSIHYEAIFRFETNYQFILGLKEVYFYSPHNMLLENILEYIKIFEPKQTKKTVDTKKDVYTISKDDLETLMSEVGLSSYQKNRFRNKLDENNKAF